MGSQWRLEPYVEESDRATPGYEEDCTGEGDDTEVEDDGAQ